LTNAYSKKLANHLYAVALHVMWVNYCRPSQVLSKGRNKVTPAMAAGLTDRVWTAEDILDLMAEHEEKNGAGDSSPARRLHARVKRRWARNNPGYGAFGKGPDSHSRTILPCRTSKMSRRRVRSRPRTCSSMTYGPTTIRRVTAMVGLLPNASLAT
jgi:hypothetical protein